MTTNRKMGRDELARYGQQMFGYGWKSSLGDHMDINRKTVSRWLAADAVADWAAEVIRAMVSIAPPPKDPALRKTACFDTIQPKISDLLWQAEQKGWTRDEIMLAVEMALIGDLRETIEPDKRIERRSRVN